MRRIVAHAARGLAGEQAQHRHRHVGEQLRPDGFPDLRHRQRRRSALLPARRAAARCARPRDRRIRRSAACCARARGFPRRRARPPRWRKRPRRRRCALSGSPRARRRRDRGKPRSGGAGWSLGRPMSYHQGMPFCAKTTAVSSPSNGLAGRSASAATPVAFKRADDEILRAERGRVVGSLDLGREFGVAGAQRQAVASHRLQMRPAHHAGHLVAGQRQPHRKMAADGARAENAYPHGECPA